MESCPFPTLTGIWWDQTHQNREPICFDESNIPECNYNFGACCFRQILSGACHECLCHETGKRHKGTPFGWHNHFTKVHRLFKADWLIKGAHIWRDKKEDADTFAPLGKGMFQGDHYEPGALTGDRDYIASIAYPWGTHLEEVNKKPWWMEAKSET